jgi:SH3 domain-containing YSC84-like protein 1
VKSLLSSSVKLGADVGLAVGPVGVGAAASTANLSADIVSFSRSKGLYGGISLDGAVVAIRNGWNNAYYGKTVEPTDIFIRGSAHNPQASVLLDTIANAVKK